MYNSVFLRELNKEGIEAFSVLIDNRMIPRIILTLEKGVGEPRLYWKGWWYLGLKKIKEFVEEARDRIIRENNL